MEERTETLATPLACTECQRLWVQPLERWRLYVTREQPPSPLPYCPECAQAEFDD